ncbi:hypothetical protein [Lacticaseibacillus brantae]|uniref:Uncharacterized protein n=1 Tax=Lacticaseibacillus brantae DSM 23927 TaxID=1423727 RepID=A0A0R2AZX5_9LACO|nr:hypothetical protein [Lacticaseibacillus brantae]KRM72829.1 hypothetical protein FC34_GL000540 [Lacticaseibacillus brantae DSM 23927]
MFATLLASLMVLILSAGLLFVTTTQINHPLNLVVDVVIILGLTLISSHFFGLISWFTICYFIVMILVVTGLYFWRARTV